MIILIALLSSCSHKPKEEKAPVKVSPPVSAKNLLKDSTVLIKFGDSDILFHWNNLSSKIVVDSLFENLKHNYKKKSGYLVDQITNVTATSASACNKDKLVIGDMAFLIINEIDGLPFFEVTHVQCDVFENNCPYPEGYFNVIGRDRKGIREKVKHYLLLKHK